MPPPCKKRNCAQGEDGSWQVTAQVNQQTNQEIVAEQENDELIKGKCKIPIFNYSY